MTKQRFEELTGIYISEYQYGIIEEILSAGWIQR